MKKPFLIIIDGPMGAGKSTTANLLKEKMKEKTALISIDYLKKVVSQHKLDSLVHHKIAQKAAIELTNFYLKEGINVIVEKAFTIDKFLKSFIKSIKQKNKMFVYQIEVPFDIGFSRVKERESQKEKGIPRRKVKEKFTRNHAHYKNGKYKGAKIFDSSKLTPKQVVNIILKEVYK